MDDSQDFAVSSDPLPPENLKRQFGIACDSDGCIGDGQFTFFNGDKYSGFFKSLKPGMIMREGNGIYTTSDGHVYDGFWASDVLDCADAIIQFPDSSSYSGPLTSMKYNGLGHYTFPDGTFIDATFLNNTLVEEAVSVTHLSYVDKCGMKWFGETGGVQVTMLPVHHFIPREWKIMGKHVPQVTTASAEAAITLKAAMPTFSFPILSRKKLLERRVQEIQMGKSAQHLKDEETSN